MLFEVDMTPAVTGSMSVKPKSKDSLLLTSEPLLLDVHCAVLTKA